MHMFDTPIPATLAVPFGRTADVLVFGLVTDPVNPTQALVGRPTDTRWKVRVHADRVTF